MTYGITFNSATSGLHAAVAACGIGPGDEVIVPPYSFTATATAVLHHNAIPVRVVTCPCCTAAGKARRRKYPCTKLRSITWLGRPSFSKEAGPWVYTAYTAE